MDEWVEFNLIWVNAVMLVDKLGLQGLVVLATKNTIK
jgi:hypothetical protein